MRPRALVLAVAVAVALALALALAAPGRAEEPADDAARLAAEEPALVALLSAHRAHHGLGPLRVSPTLTDHARAFAADMARTGVFSPRHVDSRGRAVRERADAAGYPRPDAAGEITAAGFPDAARTFHQWLRSPGHEQGIRVRAWRAVGVASAASPASPHRWFWVAVFGPVDDGAPDRAAAWVDLPPPGRATVTVELRPRRAARRPPRARRADRH